MTIHECADNDDLSTRLWREAAAYWEHVPDDFSLRKADPAGYQRYIDEHPISTVQFIAYLVVDIFTAFCNSWNNAAVVKLFLCEIGLLTGSVQVKNVRQLLGFTGVFSKVPNMTKPLRERSIYVFANAEGTRLNEDGTLANGVQAEEASLWEIMAKKAAQIADWVKSAIRVGKNLAGQNWVQTLSWLKGVSFLAGVILSGQGLYENLTRLWTGNIVRADPNDKVKSADGFVWKMKLEDEIHSWIKIVMNVAYLALRFLGLASVLAGAVVAPAITPLLFVGTTANLLSYFWEKICIDPIGRKNQAAIV